MFKIPTLKTRGGTKLCSAPLLHASHKNSPTPKSNTNFSAINILSFPLSSKHISHNHIPSSSVFAKTISHVQDTVFFFFLGIANQYDNFILAPQEKISCSTFSKKKKKKKSWLHLSSRFSNSGRIETKQRKIN